MSEERAFLHHVSFSEKRISILKRNAERQEHDRGAHGRPGAEARLLAGRVPRGGANKKSHTDADGN